MGNPTAVLLGVTVLACVAARAVEAQPGMNQLANLNPDQVRAALRQFPGTSEKCVDLFVDQMTTCASYFETLQSRFPDLEAANGQELLSFVMSNPPEQTCCLAIDVYNYNRCICERGTLPMAQRFPQRYWGLLEAGRCPGVSYRSTAIITPQMC